MDRKVKEAIWSIMDNEANLEQEFVIDLLKQYVPALDVENLKEKEYKRMSNSLISSYRDEKGIRDVFVITNDNDMTAYINISRSKEIDDLKQVKNRLENNVKGNQKSLSKVDGRLFLIENQISLADIMKSEGAI